MPKNTSPNSVGYRKPKFIFSDDPRAIDTNTFENFVSKAGSEVIVRQAQTSFMDLDEYTPTLTYNTYTVSSIGSTVYATSGWNDTSNLFLTRAGMPTPIVDASTDSLSDIISSSNTGYIQISGYGFGSLIPSGADILAITATVLTRGTYDTAGYAFSNVKTSIYNGATAIQETPSDYALYTFSTDSWSTVSTQNLYSTGDNGVYASGLVTPDLDTAYPPTPLTGVTRSDVINSDFGVKWSATRNTLPGNARGQLWFAQLEIIYGIWQ